MAPTAAMLAAGCGAALCFGAPLLCVILLAAKHKSPWLPLLAGMAVYLLWKILFPWIAIQLADWGPFQTQHWLYALVTGVISGGLLEGGTAAAFLLLRNRREWSDAFAVGIGAGGLSAIFGAGVYSANYLFYANLANTGRLQDYALQHGMAASAYPDFLQAIVERGASSLWTAGLSALFALLLRMTLSLLVLETVRRRKPLPILIALASHLLTDSLASLFSQWGLPDWAPCLLLGLLVLAAGIWVGLRKPWQSEAGPAD